MLRLADVIGAFDSTDRWWQYQVWIEAAVKASLPVYIKENLKDSRISLVYVKDVSQVVMGIVRDKFECDSIKNQCFNLACLETCTVKELVQKIAEFSHKQGVQVEFSSDDVPQMYPSVERGPIDITKAQKIMNFNPVPLDKACEEIVGTYSSVQSKKGYESEKESVLEDLKEDLEDIYVEQSFKSLMEEAKSVLSL